MRKRQLKEINHSKNESNNLEEMQNGEVRDENDLEIRNESMGFNNRTILIERRIQNENAVRNRQEDENNLQKCNLYNLPEYINNMHFLRNNVNFEDFDFLENDLLFGYSLKYSSQRARSNYKRKRNINFF